MTDPTPEELELWKLANIGDPEEFVPALRDREALIEAAAIVRAAEIPLQWLRNYPAAETRRSINLSILALAKPGARTLLGQRIAEAEQAGYERGVREANK